MKKYLISIFVILMFLTVPAYAKDVQLICDPVNFEEADSDMAQSGYRWYESSDEGATKNVLGETDTSAPSYSFVRDDVSGLCYFVTAYNQFGESDYSDAACAYAPPKPLDLRILIQELITFLQDTLDSTS